MENKSDKLGTMPEGKLLFQMSLPIIISMLVQAVYNIVDSIFVSRLSEEALTAVSISFPIQNIMIGVAVGIGVGISALLGRYLGMKDKKMSKQVALHGVLLCLMASIIFVLVGKFLAGAFIRSQTDNEVIINYGIDYLSVVCSISFGVFFQILFEKLLQATSLTIYTMVTQLTGAIINIILDPIMIFGLFGFPRLEVKGAAIATVIGQVVGALIGLAVNKTKNKELNFKLSEFSFKPRILKEVLRIGFPSMVMNSIGSFAVYLMNTILSVFGQSAIAAYGVMFKLQSFVCMPVFGISNAMVSILSYNYGARLKERMKKFIKISIIAATCMVIFASALLFIFPSFILNLFDATDTMAKIGYPMIRTVCISNLPLGFSIISVSIFQSLGNAKIAVLEPILRQIVVLIPFAYLLSLSGNVNMVWYAFIAAQIVSATLCFVYVRKDYREKIETL